MANKIILPNNKEIDLDVLETVPERLRVIEEKDTLIKKVDEFDDLPDPSDEYADRVYIVRKTTGVIGSRKLAGLYLCDGDKWNRISKNQLKAYDSDKLEGKSLSDLTEFCAIEGPNSYNDKYKANWEGTVVNTNKNYFSTSKAGIKVKKEGYYYCEVVQRAKKDKNRYVGLSVDGDRGKLENSNKGVWGHDHSSADNNWARSFYLGWLDSDTQISGGWVNKDDGKWGKTGYYGIIQVRRIK